MVGVAVLWMLACRDEPDEAEPRPSETEDSGVTQRTSGTGDTSNVPTGSTPSTDTGATVKWKELAPSLTLDAPTGFRCVSGLSVFVEGGRGVLGCVILIDAVTATSYTYEGLPRMPWFAIDGLRGRHELAAAWDGVSAMEFAGPGDSLQVPDMTGDGVADYWLGHELAPGPLLGRVTTREDHVVAFFDDGEMVVAGGFDADGDGVHDLLTMHGEDQATIHYGPFSLGRQPSPRNGEVPRDQYSTLGSGEDNLEPIAWVLEDHYNGKDGVVIGSDGLLADSLAFVLEVPRGTHVRTLDAKARVSKANLSDLPIWRDVGDVNGDGQPDVINGSQFVPELSSGPVEGVFRYADGDEDLPDALGWDKVLEDPRFGIGDLNGDGVQEIVATTAIGWDPKRPYTSGERWTVVLFSPHSDPLDMRCALPIGGQQSEATDGTDFGEHALDLDGDGLTDIVNVSDDQTHVNVWWGVDLVAAHDALPPCP